MKTSKKIIIPFFSTVVGLSMAAGIGGAFAWYQYNSQATASFVGSSVADTGVLQIGWKALEDDDNDPTTPDVEVMHWGRDFYKRGNLAKMVPVTFGKMETLNPGLNTEKTLVLPQNAYAYPEAGAGSGYSNWEPAVVNEDYAQFEIYLRALVPDTSEPSGYALAARNVFLSDYILESVENDKVAEEALRIHIGFEDGQNLLISKNEYTEQAPLDLHGQLDLDANGQPDTYHETPFSPLPAGVNDGDPIEYGVEDDTQVTTAIDDLKVERDPSTGKMPTSGADFDKKIITTSASEPVKMTVTIWLEGWEYLKTGEDAQSQDVKSQVWNPEYSAETDVQVGLQFDTGIFRGDDLNQ